MPRIVKAPEVRRNELMDVAEHIFVEKGCDRTSPSDIIRAAGVAQGTFYNYFKSKDEIVRAIIVRYLERYEQYVEEVAGNGNLSALEKARLILDAFDVLTSRKMRMGGHVRDLMVLSGQVDYWRCIRERIYPSVQQVLQQGIDEGVFKAEYPEETAEVLIVINQHLHDDLKRIDDPEARERKIAATRAAMERIVGARTGTLRRR